eukprot:7093002-Pyramimonas_sp.AAC.1
MCASTSVPSSAMSTVLLGSTPRQQHDAAASTEHDQHDHNRVAEQQGAGTNNTAMTRNSAHPSTNDGVTARRAGQVPLYAGR